MPTSDEDLAKQAAEVAKLREQLADEQTRSYVAAKELSNDVTAAQLIDEASTLKAQIAALKSANTKTAVKEGAAAVLDPQGNAAAIEQAKVDAGTSQLVDSGAAAESTTTSSKGGSK